MPKEEIIHEKSTARSAKGSNSYADGEPVVGPTGMMRVGSEGTQRNSDSRILAAPTDLTSAELTYSYKENKVSPKEGKRVGSVSCESIGDLQGRKVTDLYRKMYTRDMFLAAYKKLKSKPGNMTPGSDGETLDQISLEKIDAIIAKLKDQSFQFRPVRRVLIPKPNGKMRPLGIPSPMDKLVQEVMRMILEEIYEPLFKESNCGFRPGRSCHTALEKISKWNGITWVIEGDIQAYFDNVDHQILSKILTNKIDDKRFIDLYWKLVSAGYVELSPRSHSSKETEQIQRAPGISSPLQKSSTGVPQGGVISPILSNIYLHSFDEFMEEQIEKYSSKEKTISKVNPEMARYSKELMKLSREFQTCRDPKVLKKFKALRLERNKKPSRIRTGTRVYYVRYADDWIVGVLGPKIMAQTLLSNIQTFLNSELRIQLNLEKTHITHIRSKRVKFLGVYFDIHSRKESKLVKRKSKVYGTIKARINQVRIYFYLPGREIIEELQRRGFVKQIGNKETKTVTSAMKKWIFLDHRNIIHRFNAVIRGYLNYFSFVDNLSVLGSIIKGILLHSCAKTLAQKFRLSSRAKVFKRFGPYLATKDAIPVGLYIPSTFKKARQFQKGKSVSVDPLEALNWRIHTQFALFQHCWICGVTDQIEMHHVRHLRKTNQRLKGFTKLMSQINRKQIPVCASCHNKIHAGTYDGDALAKLQAGVRRSRKG